MSKSIEQLIINSPYEEPSRYHHYDEQRRRFELREGRRKAGYVVASRSARGMDDPGEFREIALVNQIRPRVKKWREGGHLGVTGITRQLLAHWHDRDERQFPFFFCQLEAIETLIWWAEAPEADKVGIDVPSDGGEFRRICSKMATGTGKTLVMSMVIAWQVLNKVSYPQDPRFSKHVFVVAPGLTVRNRLSVLKPSGDKNYYDAFNIVPVALREKLNQGKVLVRNWHALAWDSEERLSKKRSVDKRGAKSDEAYVRQVLDELSNCHNLLVLNDEAHHAWRVAAQLKSKGLKREEEKATIWVGGLDRIHRARGILNCFDFSATPFVPSGKQSSEEALFGWIVSDFGLNDAIESGLVKTPRIVVRDDGRLNPDTYKSRLYHLYGDDEVKDDLNSKALPEAALPDLLTNAYYLLGYDWRETFLSWRQPIPPVMITVANRTETAARIETAFLQHRIGIEELSEPKYLLRIDSKALDEAEKLEEPAADFDLKPEAEEDGEDVSPLTKSQQAEELRKKVDTVGQKGEPGEQIRNVISVGMLSEGWDAKNVTHIMGLRAFSSQLLCEQVVGRGLRRMSYEVNEATGLLEPEYVNIFGVPFTFLPHEEPDPGIVKPKPPPTCVEADPLKWEHEISWPNMLRINYELRSRLALDMDQIDSLELDINSTILTAEVAQAIGGKPDLTKATEIQLTKLAEDMRMQRIIFEAARNVFDQAKPNWKGNRELLLAQVIRLVEQFIVSDRLVLKPPLFAQNPLRRRLLITLNLNKIVQHIWESIKEHNEEDIAPVFDRDLPIRSTANMPTWYTSKPCEATRKSHINVCVYDSTWEASHAFELDRNEAVNSWVKNDHLGFDILYQHNGVIRKYRPDFLARLRTDEMLILETKGQSGTEVEAKRRACEEWVRAVNTHGGFGKWRYKVVYDIKGLAELLGQEG